MEWLLPCYSISCDIRIRGSAINFFSTSRTHQLVEGLEGGEDYCGCVCEELGMILVSYENAVLTFVERSANF